MAEPSRAPGVRGRLAAILDRLVDLSALFGALALVLAAAVILVDIVGRFFGAPLAGAQDLTQMLMVIIVFGGMALCDRQGGHIRMDVFEEKLPPRLNRWLDVAAALLGAAIFAGIGWTMLESARISVMLNLATNIIHLPKAYFQWALAGCALLTAATMLARALRGVVTGSGTAPGHADEAL